MSRGRTIQGDSPCAFRVVVKGPTWTKFHGPYSTIGAAKGVATAARNDAKRWHKNDNIEVIIEKTPDGWEKVLDV